MTIKDGAAEAALRCRCLGVMEVRGGDGWRTVRGARLRSLLAALVLHCGAEVSPDQLVAQVWGGSAPASARSLVRGYVMSLRRAFGPDGAAIVAGRRTGYRFALPRDSVDSYRFERLCAEGRAALRAGELWRSRQVLAEALGLWSGPALPDTPRNPSLAAYAARLEELRLVALEGRIEADLHLHRHREILGELRQLVDEHPGRERLVAQWMRALYADGRRAEALDAYLHARQRLVGEFGIEPGPELRRVHQSILSADGLGDPEPPRHPTAGGTTRDARRPAGPPSPAPAVAEADRTPPGEPRRPWQTPADIADFIGRERELAECERWLGSPGTAALRVVAICGRAGVGKSTLAVRLAHRLQPTYPDGQLYADLRSDSQPARPADVLGTFLRGLGVPGVSIPEDTDERVAMFRSLLADRRLLVVLDNAVDERQVRPLLPGGPGCAVLVTSRARLSALAGAHLLNLDVFPVESALALLERSVGAPRFRAERAAARELIGLCGHLPLAVRILAARVAASPHTPLSWFVDQLTDERRRLDELRVGDLDVRASIGSGLRAMAEPEHRVLRRLALFDAPDVPAWVAAAAADLAPAEAEAAMRALVARRLLDDAGVDRCGQLRYRFHPLVRLFARERAEREPAGERAAAVDRVLAGWLTVARHADRHAPARTLAAVDAPAPAWPVPESVLRIAERDPFGWFEAEAPALMATVLQAAAAGRSGAAWRLAAAAHCYYELRNMYDDGQRTHETALAACQAAGDELGTAVLRRNLADLFSSKPGSDVEVKLGHATAAGELFRRLGERRGEADAWYLCASVHRTRGEHQAAVRCLATSYRLARQAGYRLGVLHVWQQLAILRRQQGRLGEALSDARIAQSLAAELHSARDRSVVLGLIGAIHRDRREVGLAEAAFTEAIAIAEQTADPLQLAFLYGHLGGLYADQGHPQARSTLVHGLALSRAGHSLFGQALALHALGRLDLAAADTDRAVARLSEAAALYRRCEHRYAEAKVLATLAQALAVAGDPARADDVREQAVRLLRRLGNHTEAESVAGASAAPPTRPRP
ncbi:NB-ARC domain-containing protein [Micromonospora globbae]|uniref:NB-ARC domain-containing protein n=1 Tax=Micromonospora globbae TaxID=1894969 RepID=A0ABZ1SE73_9ACTN|nr:BTAD domain-containing putative transcriptional regulator [Micromonospora globbae]